MKSRIFIILMVIALIIMGVNPVTVKAGAYESDFVTSITYQNIGPATTTTLSLLFYDSPTDTSPFVHTLNNLASYASSSIYVGSILSTSFEGTAVMAADQPMAAVLVQVSTNSAVKVRPLSNGFVSGTPTTLVPTVFKASNINTIFSVQNAGTSDTTATIKFINTSATQVHSFDQLLKPGAGIVVDAGTLAALGTSFNGSVVVESTPAGSLVSSAMELGTGADVTGRAFEGVGQGATTVYLPSAACNASNQTSYYAIQNTSLSQSTNVTVTYSNGSSRTKTIGPGAKQAFSGCEVDTGTMPNGFGGSAVVTSNTTPIVAVGKTAGLGWQTAYLGFVTGAPKVALPYVRWANNSYFVTGGYQRTYIAIQNLSGFSIPANEVRIRYIDQNGVLKGTHTINTAIANGGKVNSDPTRAGLTEFGYWNNYTVAGGGAIVEYTGSTPGVQLAVIARIITYTGPTTFAGEDYSGIPIP
jgi:hypothetical protein